MPAVTQSRLGSLAESAVNVASGYVVALFIGIWVYPLFGIQVTLNQNVGLTLIFTVTSLLRSYIWRRIFARMA